MRVCYDKLWRLLKDNKMQKRDLASAAELSSYTMTKYSLQGTTQGNGLTGGVPPVRFSM